MAKLLASITSTCLLLLATLLLATLLPPAHALETFTNPACQSATASMGQCASRWDSIRLECKKSITTNTIWPGPCECAYYANDLPCFDEVAICADQVWTQVPQWFRDGVSSCVMKDASYTIRANLGSAQGVMGNPFTVQDLRGQATRTAAQTGAGPGLVASETGIPREADGGLSTGAKAGFGVGIGVGVVMVAVLAFFIARSRKRAVRSVDVGEKKLAAVELQDEEARIHQVESRMVYPKSEMPGVTSPKFELGVRASTWLVELPVQSSNRNSQHRS